MAAYDVSKIWDGEAAQIFEGAGDGTDIGFTGAVSIAIERTQHLVKASQTGDQILDIRNQGQQHKVAIDFKEVGQADFFKEWWYKGHPEATGVVQLHKGTVGDSATTKRLRFHPMNLGVDLTRDLVFERLAIVSGPSMVLNGNGEHVHRIEMIDLPVAASLPTIEVGVQNHVPA